LRVFNAVEGEDEAAAGAVCRCVAEVFDGEEFFGTDYGDDALVGAGSGYMGKLLAGFRAHADAGLTALGDELFHAAVMPLAGDEHVVETAAAGAKRLLDCMHAVENVHEG
jgi:hypothetical protein